MVAWIKRSGILGDGPGEYATWLEAPADGRERLELLLDPYPAAALDAYPVGRYVNRRENEGEFGIAPMV